MKYRDVYALFVGLALAAGLGSAAHAFTLGDLRGSVVVGRAVDVSVMVQAAPDEDISPSCFSAEVFHADTLQPNASVSVTPQPGTTPASFKVRIQSRAPVDEPVVTVQLRSTCANAFARRYVVLADFPVVVTPSTEPASSLPAALPVATNEEAPAAVTPPARTAAVPAGAAQAEPSVTVPTVQPVVKAKPKRVVRKKRVVKAPKQKVVAAPPVEVSAPAKPALKLEALNLPSGQVDGLGGAPLTLPSPESLLQAKQIEALQAELKALKDSTAKNNAALADLQVQLHKAQTERVSLQLFYVVLALLLMSVAVLVWLLWQRYRDQPSADSGVSILTEMSLNPTDVPDAGARALQADKARLAETIHKSTQSWWQAEPTPAGTEPNRTGTPTPVSPVTPVAPVTPLAQKTGVPATLQDLNHAFTNTRLQDAGNSDFAAIAHEEVDLDIDMSSWVGLDDNKPSSDAGAESIQDIRQQAEFFVSLGQTERALFVLKKQIAQGGKPNPLIYLDLLSLFHSLGYKTDFREYRTAFNRYFNCVLPDFPAYPLEGLDLTAYTDELARLTQVWNRKEAIAYLDACIYRSEQTSAQPSFDLAAFRDLLLLSAIAEQVVGGDPA